MARNPAKIRDLFELKHSFPAVLAPRRGLRREEAAQYVGLSPRKFDDLVKAGRLPKPARIDGVVLWDIRRLDVFLDEIFRHDDEVQPNPWDG